MVEPNPEPSVSPEPEPSPEPSPDYRESFTPETKTALEKFDSVEKLADGYISLEKDASRLRNEKGLIVPDENASTEDITAFHKAIGVPETPEGYEIVKPDLPEGIPYSEERMNKFSEIAHKAGISKAGFQAIVNAHNEDVKEQFESSIASQKELRTQGIAAQKKEWGNDYEPNLAKADAVIVPLFGEAFKQKLVETGLNHDPAIINGLFKVSQAVSEHSFTQTGTGPTGEGLLTKGNLQEMTNNPQYYDPSRRNDDYVKKVEQYAKDLAEQNTSGANANP